MDQPALASQSGGGKINPENGWFRVVDGVRLFYRDQGSGLPVLLLHGIPTSSFLWRDIAPVIARTHRVICPDLPGSGRSAQPEGRESTVAGWADAVEALLESLKIDRFALVGHDLGALVAAELLARMPERISHLVLTNTSLRIEGWTGKSPLSLLRLPVLGELAMAMARRWMLRLAMTVYVARRERLTRETLDGYWQPFEQGYKRTLLGFFRTRPFSHEDFGRWRGALESLSVPCLIVWGRLDPTFTLAEAEDLERLIPGAKLIPLDHANHFLQEDSPEELGRLIASFVDEPAS